MFSCRLARRGLPIVAVSLGIAAFLACGTDPVGVDACRRIEGARCESAYGCGIDLTKPVHRGDTPSLDVGACKRYYEDACLHGLVAREDPGSVKVEACVQAITDPNTSCEVVRTPEIHPACAFLSSAPATPADAATDATVDANTDAP